MVFGAWWEGHHMVWLSPDLSLNAATLVMVAELSPRNTQLNRLLCVRAHITTTKVHRHSIHVNAACPSLLTQSDHGWCLRQLSAWRDVAEVDFSCFFDLARRRALMRTQCLSVVFASEMSVLAWVLPLPSCSSAVRRVATLSFDEVCPGSLSVADVVV